MATITKEMEKQGARRGTVMNIGRGAAFKESLDFARVWVPALIEQIKTRVVPLNTSYRLVTNVVSADKIAVITLDRMLGRLLANRQGVTQHAMISSISEVQLLSFTFIIIFIFIIIIMIMIITITNIYLFLYSAYVYAYMLLCSRHWFIGAAVRVPVHSNEETESKAHRAHAFLRQAADGVTHQSHGDR